MYTDAKTKLIESTDPAIQAAKLLSIKTYATDSAITFTEGLNVAKLTKGSAGAYTLAAPTAIQEGTRLLLLCQSAFAHVVTATDLLDDGVTGGAKDTATFGAFVGSSLDLIAINLKWHVVGKNVVTIAAV